MQIQALIHTLLKVLLFYIQYALWFLSPSISILETSVFTRKEKKNSLWKLFPACSVWQDLHDFLFQKTSWSFSDVKKRVGERERGNPKDLKFGSPKMDLFHGDVNFNKKTASSQRISLILHLKTWPLDCLYAFQHIFNIDLNIDWMKNQTMYFLNKQAYISTELRVKTKNLSV